MGFVELGKDLRSIAGQHQLQQTTDPPAICEAKHVAHLLRRDCSAAMRDCLVEDRQPVAC